MGEETITVEELDRIDAYCAKAVDGPWFVAGDKAEDCSPHTDSGLALVDTGRSADWTIARLCQWHEAEFIAAARTDLPRLSAAVRAATKVEHERDAWKDTAERHCRNEQFYHGIIEQIGPMLGPEVYTSDDGSVQDSVLALKVVEVVSELRARVNALEVALNMVIKKVPKVLEPNVNAHYQILLSGREIVSIREALAEGESPEGNRYAR